MKKKKKLAKSEDATNFLHTEKETRQRLCLKKVYQNNNKNEHLNFSIITLTVIGRCVNQSFEHLSFNCILYLFVFYERLFQFFFNCAFGGYIG